VRSELTRAVMCAERLPKTMDVFNWTPPLYYNPCTRMDVPP
jgi:hypothetical protein